MGQSQSHSASLEEMDAQLEQVRSELYQLEQEGREQRQRFDQELFDAESELYNMRMKLLKRGEESKSIWNFWDYAKEVQQTLHAKPSKPSKKAPAVTTPPSESRALVAPWYFFNIHSLFEAMLLRRLHIAMMLQGQRDVQSSAWNSVIVHIFQMIPGIRESKKKTQDEFEKTKVEIHKNIAHSRESYQKQLLLQKELVQFMRIEALKDSGKPIPDALRESMTSVGSASTQPLPKEVTHEVPAKNPDGTTQTEDDSSDASSLTSSSSSSVSDSSVSDEEQLKEPVPEPLTEPVTKPVVEPVTERV